MSNPISITVCVPALNEEKTLRPVIEDLFSNLAPKVEKLEVIIVDDGSADSTGKIADELSNEFANIKAVHHKTNLGIGASFSGALAVAKNHYFFCFPADGEDQAKELTKFLPYLDGSSVVTCYHRGSDKRTLLRRLISSVYTVILNLFFNLRLKYYNGLTIFPAVTLRSLNIVSRGFSVFAESLIKASKKGCKIVQIEASLGKRKEGKSKALGFRSFSRMAKDILRLI